MLERLRTVVKEPALFSEYANWTVQKLLGSKPTRQIHGVEIGSFANFSEFHSVSNFVSKTEKEFLEGFDFGSGAIVDIGANLGVVSLLLARRFPNRRVAAFEPAPSTYAALRDNVKRNGAGIECYQLAISDADGEVKFAASDRERATASIAQAEARANAINVPARRLDTLMPELGIEQIAFLKVDVEGYEAAVFRGAVGMLKSIRPNVIYFEVCPELARRGGFGSSEAARMLGDVHYDLFEIVNALALNPVAADQAENITLANWLALPRAVRSCDRG